MKLIINYNGVFDIKTRERYYPEPLLDWCDGNFIYAFSLNVMPIPLTGEKKFRKDGPHRNLASLKYFVKV